MTINESSFPSVYIVVLHYNGYDDTKKCVESLIECKYPNKHIIVVDNSSTNNSYHQLCSDFPDLQMYSTGLNSGYAGGMNFGIKLALSQNADYVLIANNDLTFEQNFLNSLIIVAQSSEKIGIVSPKINQMENKQLIYSAGLEIDLLKGGTYNPYRDEPAMNTALEDRRISFADGACLLVKRRVFEEIGLFNDAYFMYFEDLDFSYRAGKKYEIVYNSKAVIYHKCGAGKGWANYSPLYYYYYTRNRFLFYKQINNFLASIYVILFSLTNGAVKSMTLLSGYTKDKHTKKKVKLALKSLWNGLLEGVLIIFNFKHMQSKKVY